jgi:glucuronate isomerase
LLTRETAGLYNTINFHGEMRAFLSIMPLRDMARRMNGEVLAGLVIVE